MSTSSVFTNETLREAVKLFLHNPDEAIRIYGPMKDWNVSGVADMSDLFKDAKLFNEPIGKWDVSNVTNMAGMFHGAKSFNQPIGHWRTNNVTDMSNMFH